MKGSLIIVGFFILGIVFGRLGWLEIGSFGFDVSFVALAMLMFCVGIGVGSDLGALRNLRTLDSRLLLLPLVTIIGTLAGCLLLGLVMPRREIPEVLAVGSGFGYYSLSSIFITQYKGAELGTVALLANISREIITLLGAPLLMRLAGPLAPISSGGATTMDTTLPIISNVSGKDFVILSIYHGFVVDFSVPFLVTFFCSI
ncbi:MAG: lysine exporter LysO family protein [Muribaculaceae bacterium]|nr:lysine exporter LysO family protein [Muribaculaceae bacterium]MDE6796139.1 lysine exporter LysO family protein [Muribaculaceae bacterium]